MSAIPEFHLYAFWRSSATFRVRAALNLKGLKAHELFVNLEAGEHLRPDFLAINPLGGIPALVQAGQPPITQSLAILEFLEELQPEPPLLPRDLHGRARVRSLAAMLASDTHPLLTPRIKKYLATQAGMDDAAWRAWQVHWFGTGLAALEQRLAREPQTGRYCHGDTVTMADVVLASILAVMRVFKIPSQNTPTIDRIMASLDALEAFALADPFRQQGAPA
ncbi:MAG: maleylacetoacetate isomerase [Serpentinimonas sp.]|jgi:maleylacetoacetate isomerase|nr:maleylacetoacetate isomerase [Serpentinimonas sp.]